MATKGITALDLFSGAGGFSLGMEMAGIEVAVAIEYDPKIAKTYKANHDKTVMINADIRTVPASTADAVFKNQESSTTIAEIFKNQGKSVDIIFGGPPCQGFSMAGNRIRKEKSFFDDERNLLFLEFLRMVQELNPKVFVIENVPGILNYNKGSIKKEIEERLAALGYDVASRVFSTEKFGVPQKRKRAIFIGNRLGLDSEQLFPEETHDEDSAVTVWDAIGDLPTLKSGEGVEITQYKSSTQNEYQKKMRSGNGKAFRNHIASTHSEKTISILKLVKPGENMKDLPSEFQTKSVHSGAYGRMEKDKPSYTLTTRINTPSVGRITHPVDDRTITPREAARIQSYPDHYHFIGDITTVGMQIGNSVPPLFAKALGDSIINKVFNQSID